MTALAVKPDDDLIVAPVRRKHRAPPRRGRNLHDVINCCADPLKGQRRDNEVALQRQIAIRRKVLQRTPPAFTIMAATCGQARRVGRDDREQPCTIALDLRLDGFARQGKRHEDRLSIMLRHAVALRAEAQDGECHGRRFHRGASSSFRRR